MNIEKRFITDGEFIEMQIQHLKPRYLEEKNEFLKCATNVERMNFFLEDKEEVEYIKSKITKIVPSLTKSDEKALELRKSGNDYYKNGRYIEATGLYTQSLAWGKSDEVVSFAYGNRSAALFTLGLYKECLVDIDRALKNGYPKNLTSKLMKRKEDAVKAQNGAKQDVHVEEIPESEKNSLIQSARSCIEIQKNEKYGRCIVATRDIKIGEILVVEKPYAATMQVDRSKDPFYFCCECLEHCYTLIPCLACQQKLYCSETCKEKAFKSYHKYECLILPYIEHVLGVYSQLMLFCLKVTLLAMRDENSGKTIYRSDRYKEISELESHCDEDPREKTYVLGLFSSNFFILLKEKTNMFKEFQGFEEKFKGLFFYHQQMVKVNAAEINNRHIDNVSNASVTGIGLYSLYSIFNHSCYPNTFWYNSGTTMTIRALSTIKKGQQCFVSYGPDFSDDHRIKRRARLQRLYKFTCECKACKEDWRTMTFPTITIDCKNNKKEVEPKLHKLIKRLSMKEATKPSAQVLSLRDAIRKAYKILYNGS